ncbi:MAG: META domain-containing protein, partial [Bacteroidota bacterium]|nr:META domain-containing protein [Bacteroidota bacterium]
VFGSTGCNRLSTTVLFTDPNLLKFASIITTKMFCPGDNESRFTGALSKVNNWSILNKELLLSDGKLLIAKLTAVSKELASALGGTWELKYVSALKNPFDSVYAQKKPYITFNLATNEISGITSCNGFTSKYTMDGNKIHIEDGLKTMMFCEGGGEEAFLNMLKKVNKYAINGNTLTFIAGDIAVMRFAKK